MMGELNSLHFRFKRFSGSMESNLDQTVMETEGGDSQPIVIYLQHDGSDLSVPLITSNNQINPEVIIQGLLQQNEILPVVEVDSHEVSVVNHIEIIPDVTQNWITGELLQSTSSPLEVEPTPVSCQSQYGQVLCIAYAVQDSETVDTEPPTHVFLELGEETDNCSYNFNEAGAEVNIESLPDSTFNARTILPVTENEDPLVSDVKSETVDSESQTHVFLELGEETDNCLFNFNEVNIESLPDSTFNARNILQVTENESTLVSDDKYQRENKKSKRKKFVSRKLTKNVIGNTLRIEEKLEVLDAMLTPVPEKVRTKRKKPNIDCTVPNNRDIGKNENTKDILYLCDMCGASFSRDTQYFGHLHKHSGERKWLCFVCPEEPEFGSQALLRQHERRTHIVLRPYSCTLCPATFDRPSQLSYHVRRVHAGERPHICKICKKSFFRRSDLRTHLNIHLGINKSICETCGKKFNHVSNLIRHSRVHTGVKPYPCSICGRRFSQLDAMHTHKNTHMDMKTIACTFCPKMFKSFGVMRKHMRYMHGDKLISMGKEAFTALKMKEGTQNRRFYCKICGESFEFSALLKHHEKLHEKENNFYCKYCKKNYINAEDLKTHACERYEVILPHQNPDYAIKQDSLTFTSDIESELEAHTVVQENGEIIIYVTQKGDAEQTQIHIQPLKTTESTSCNNGGDQKLVPEQKFSCGKMTDLVNSMAKSDVKSNNYDLSSKTNAVSIHSVKNEPLENSDIEDDPLDTSQIVTSLLTIDTSSKSTDSKILQTKVEIKVPQKKQLKAALLRKEDPTTSKKSIFKNDVYSKSKLYRSGHNTELDSENLDINEMIVVVDDEDELGVKKIKRMYRCPECPKRFNKCSNFRQHLGIHYIHLMRHSCPTCGQLFAWKSTLNKHILKHHSDGPVPKYQCDFCDREYSFQVQVQEHIKRDHYKYRPHECKTCKKTFYKKYDLHIHERTHTKEKPYICGTCSKRFYHLSHIIRHERIHSGIRPYKCTDCGREFSQSSSLKSHRLRHLKAVQRNEIQEVHTLVNLENDLNDVPEGTTLLDLPITM